MEVKTVDDTKKVYAYKQDFTLSLIQSMYNKGKFIPQPNILRDGMLDLKEASSFIESILMNKSIYPVYLCEEIDGNLTILDGQIRLTAIVGYMNNKYALEGLKRLKKLNGKRFTELDESMQETIKCYILNSIIIKEQ